MNKAYFFRRFAKLALKNIFNIPEEKIFLINGYILLILRLFFKRPFPITWRGDLAALFKLSNLKGAGVEIGVMNGEFSETILRYSNLSILYSVDPWKKLDEDCYDDIANVDAAEQERRYGVTTERLKKYKERSKILRMVSCEACRLFGPETLEFIYIDANHSYEACKKDIETWWPKLKKGGVFAGHDYLNCKLPAATYGVKKAVDEFIASHKQGISITREEWPTWYLVKGAHLNRRYVLKRLLNRQS